MFKSCQRESNLQGETKFSKRIRVDLDKIPNSYWIRIESVSLRGVPDLLGVIAGRFVGLEFKVSKKASLKRGHQVLQKYTIEKIKESGGYATMLFPENEKKVLSELMEISRNGQI